MDYKDHCIYFGKVDGMVGCCVDCSVENTELWEACLEEKYKGVVPKKIR